MERVAVRFAEEDIITAAMLVLAMEESTHPPLRKMAGESVAILLIGV